MLCQEQYPLHFEAAGISVEIYRYSCDTAWSYHLAPAIHIGSVFPQLYFALAFAFFADSCDPLYFSVPSMCL